MLAFAQGLLAREEMDGKVNSLRLLQEHLKKDTCTQSMDAPYLPPSLVPTCAFLLSLCNISSVTPRCWCAWPVLRAYGCELRRCCEDVEGVLQQALEGSQARGGSGFIPAA